MSDNNNLIVVVEFAKLNIRILLFCEHSHEPPLCLKSVINVEIKCNITLHHRLQAVPFDICTIEMFVNKRKC